MKRFLWLVVALATMVLVGCSNNAGVGGDSPKSSNNNVAVEGWWKYLAEANEVSLTTYIKYDKDGNVLRAGTDKEYTGQYLEMYQVNLTYDKLKGYANFSKITDESELPSWAQENENDDSDESVSPAKQLEKDLLEWGSGTVTVNGVRYELSFTLSSEQNPLLKLTLTEYRQNQDPYTIALNGYIAESSGELYFWKKESFNSFGTTSPVRIENGSVFFTRGSQIHVRLPDIISFSKGNGENWETTETVIDKLLVWQEGVASIPQGTAGTSYFKIMFKSSANDLKNGMNPISLEVYQKTFPANEYTLRISKDVFVKEIEGGDAEIWEVTDTSSIALTKLIYYEYNNSVKFENGNKIYFAWPEVTPITFYKE